MLKRLLFPFLFAPLAFASTTLQINTTGLPGGTYSGAYVRVDLQNCTSASLVNSGQSVSYTQKVLLQAGNATVTLPDNTTQIICDGQQTSYYTFTLISNGTQTTIKSVVLPPGGPFALSNLASITTPPFNPGVIQGPKGDGFTQRGTWTPFTSYNTFDVVQVGTASYYSPSTQVSGATFDSTLWTPIGTGTSAVQSVNGQTGDVVIAAGGASVPATTALLRGTGTANGVTAATSSDVQSVIGPNVYDASGAAIIPHNEAGALSPINSGLVCDAVETPVTDSSGRYLYSTVTGTDNTSKAAAWIPSLGVTTVIGSTTQLAVPTGVGADQTAVTSYQQTSKLPPGCGIRVHTWPTMPDGVHLDLNHGTIYVDTASGNGPLWVNNNNGNVSGSSNNLITNGRIIYIGSPGTSTGTCTGFIGGSSNEATGVTCGNFHVGIEAAGIQLSQITKNTLSHNDVGIDLTAATFGPPSVVSQTGTPSVDNNVDHNTYRSNKVNVVCDGCTANYIGSGSASNGAVAGIVFGWPEFTYVDTLAVTTQGTCTASTTVPLTLSGGSPTFPAEAILVVDGSGHQTAYSINGGKGYTSAPTVSVPSGCTVAPVITAHTTSLNVHGWTAAATSGSSQNLILMQNIENEGYVGNNAANGMLRPGTGFQIILDSTATDNYFTRHVNGLGITGVPQSFARFMRNEGLNNIVYDSLLASLTDPATGSTCPYISTGVPGLELHATRRDGDLSQLICDQTGSAINNYQNAAIGWDNDHPSAHGWTGFGTTTGNANADQLLRSYVPGEAYDRLRCTINGDCNWSSGSAAADLKTGRVDQATYTGSSGQPAFRVTSPVITTALYFNGHIPTSGSDTTLGTGLLNCDITAGGYCYMRMADTGAVQTIGPFAAYKTNSTGGGGATTPNTTTLIKGNGAANSTTVATSADVQALIGSGVYAPAPSSGSPSAEAYVTTGTASSCDTYFGTRVSGGVYACLIGGVIQYAYGSGTGGYAPAVAPLTNGSYTNASVTVSGGQITAVTSGSGGGGGGLGTGAYLEAVNSSSQSLTNAFSAINMGAAITDTASGWNGTDTYTIPTSGTYEVQAYIHLNNNSTSTSTVSFGLGANTTLAEPLGFAWDNTLAMPTVSPNIARQTKWFIKKIHFNAGDAVKIVGYGGIGVADSGVTIEQIR